MQILNPLDHGYELQDELLVPTVVTEPTIPDDFPYSMHLCQMLSAKNMPLPYSKYKVL